MCKKTFSCTSSLKKHKITHHQKKKAGSGGGGSANSPVRKAAEDGPGVTCQICQRQFKKEKYLIQHVRIHTGERPYPCAVCGRAFSRQSILWKHKKTHQGPHKCELCSRRFPQPALLERHVAEDHAATDGELSDGLVQSVLENGLTYEESASLDGVE